MAVDPRFPTLMRNLRHDNDLSLRELASTVHYSHTYLSEIETGRKRPTTDIARALDNALSAGGMLAELVTDPSGDVVNPGPLMEAMQLIDANREQVRKLVETGWTSQADPQARQAATQWARFAVWLYDALVRGRPPLARWGPHRYARSLRQQTELSPFRAEVEAQGRTPHVECISISEQPAPPDVAQRLGIEPYAAVVCRQNRYFADDEPVQLGATYIPLHVADLSLHLRARALGRGSLYARLEEAGYAPERIREVVRVRIPTPAEAEQLTIAPAVPVFDVLHTSYDNQRRPFEATRFTVRADRTVLHFELPVES